MKKSKSWLMLGAAMACIGCCAVPLYLIISGFVSAGAIAALWNPKILELVVCLLPLMVLIGYWIYRRTMQKNCCASNEGNCQPNQCTTQQFTAENAKTRDLANRN